MSYDHHTKAGNEGDVVKHVALLAVLDSLLGDHHGSDLRYADIFAGYAYSPMIRGNGWEKGVGKLFQRGEQLSENCHTKLWHEWYLRGRPHLLGGVYPGSSLIATDVCQLHKKQPRLALWDLSPAVIANLMETFWGQGHHIFCRPATPAAKPIKTADFVFIDPPGLQSRKNRSYPSWDELHQFFVQRPQSQSVMVWLPVKAKTTTSPPEEDDASVQARSNAEQYGLRTIRVRWRRGGQTIGCILMGCVPDTAWVAMEAAVRHVVTIADWQAQLGDSVVAVL